MKDAGLLVSPTVHYMFQTSGAFYGGVGLRVMLPFGPFAVTSYDATTSTNTSSSYFPITAMLSLMVGWIGS